MIRTGEPLIVVCPPSPRAEPERTAISARSHRLAVLFVVLISPHVTAGDSDPVRRPYVEVGDCWTYKADRMNHRGQIGDYEECVTYVDYEKNVIFAVAKLKKDGREIDTSYSLEWEERIDIEGGIFSRESSRAHRFPLRVGDEWTEQMKFRRAILGTNEGTITFHIKVVGWEDVSVPAGRFRALRLEASGLVKRYDVASQSSVSVIYWYAPEVSRYVKTSFDTPDGVRGYELNEYRLNK